MQGQYISQNNINFSNFGNLHIEPKSKETDLENYPKINPNPNKNNVITIGDMHGNTMKFIWFLIKEGVVNLDPKLFNQMWKDYIKISNDIENNNYFVSTNTCVENFKKAINQITVNPGFNIRLLGDFLADRGACDLLTLCVLKKLDEQPNAKLEITLSDHDVNLLDSYKLPIYNWNMQFNPATSMAGLLKYIKHNNGSAKQELEDLIDKHYLPKLNILSYDLSEDGKNIAVFMHAPNNFDVIQNLAEQFLGIHNITKNITAKELAKLIDQINDKFHHLPEQERKKIYENCITTATNNDPSPNNPFTCLVWNRLRITGGIIDSNTWPDCVTCVGVGHNIPNINPPKNSKQCVLDNLLGKMTTYNDNYNVLFTNTAAPKLTQQYQKNLNDVVVHTDKGKPPLSKEELEYFFNNLC